MGDEDEWLSTRNTGGDARSAHAATCRDDLGSNSDSPGDRQERMRQRGRKFSVAGARMTIDVCAGSLPIHT